MNWFKKSKHNMEFDWDVVSRHLVEENGIMPTTEDVQEELLRRMLDDLYKEDNLLEETL
jgi:hypothetical protein